MKTTMEEMIIERINTLTKTTLEETVTQTMKSKALQKKFKKQDKSS